MGLRSSLRRIVSEVQGLNGIMTHAGRVLPRESGSITVITMTSLVALYHGWQTADCCSGSARVVSRPLSTPPSLSPRLSASVVFELVPMNWTVLNKFITTSKLMDLSYSPILYVENVSSKIVGDLTTEMSIFGSLRSPKFCLNVYGRFVDSRLEQKLPNRTIGCVETFKNQPRSGHKPKYFLPLVA